MKKILTVIAIVLSVLAVIMCLFLPQIVDDLACERYKLEIENVISEVNDVRLIDMLNGCGNVANGNHTYLIVTALIETEYQKEDVKDKFPKAYDIMLYEELSPQTKTSRQFAKNVTDDSKNYYVLIYAKSAPFYYMDFRGH